MHTFWFERFYFPYFSYISGNLISTDRATYARGVTMHKLAAFVSGIIIATIILMSTGATIEGHSTEAGEKVILRLLRQPTADAVDEYYGEHRQYCQEEVLRVQKVTESPYYEVVIQVETFYGAHNPPYALDTMAFHIDPVGEVQLVRFEHQNEVE